MPGRMELDFIAAVAEAVMCAQHRFAFVGLESPALHLFCPEPSPEFAEPPIGPSRLFAPNHLHQSSVSEIEVVSRQRRRLVENFMGDFAMGNFKRIHKALRTKRENLLLGGAVDEAGDLVVQAYAVLIVEVHHVAGVVVVELDVFL